MAQSSFTEFCVFFLMFPDVAKRTKNNVSKTQRKGNLLISQPNPTNL